ncbi:MAG: DUF305 domain-containing protein [Pseudomonadota bacterium]
MFNPDSNALLTIKRLALVVLISAAFQLTAKTVQDIPIIKPGAPGQASQTLSAEEAINLTNTSFTKDDVVFMQNMIPHHAQAVEMGVLVAERTNNQSIIDIAGRIEKAQDDEIDFMRRWLQERGQQVEIDHSHHMDHSMMGMATPEQMQALADAKGTDFDALFLKLMIPHHEGAVRMVEDLLEQPGSAYDPVLFDFLNDIVQTQEAEIELLDRLLAGLSADPRAGLAAGFDDAEEAILNLRKITTLAKPSGFFDPANPANIPPVVIKDEDKESSEKDAHGHDAHDHDGEHAHHSADDTRGEGDVLPGDAETKTEYSERWPLLSFANTDMAFSGNTLVAGNYHGFNVYSLDNNGVPELKSSIVCPGGQGDVSIAGDLLIMSVEETRGRIDCGLEGIEQDISDERFRGLRIFDISDLTFPTQVGMVQTCRGSHTHSIVSEDDDTVVVYNSGTSIVREGEELEGCIGEVPGDERTALFRIDVIEIPKANPADAKITSSPAVFADEEGRVAGLWLGGDHGEGTQETRPTDECHDITVFPSAKIAAGACSGNGILLDISDPLNPTRIDDVLDTGFAYWHSATFNNDGTKVLFTDEWGGGMQPRCRASDPMNWGANAIYEINNNTLEFASYFKIDAPQSATENCVAHNGSIIPVPGRDIFVQAWYQGGVSVIDFTDASAPKEIAYFDRGPIYAEEVVLGGYWSTYWYNGKIYGTEIVRGLDVFGLIPSEYITENEINAAAIANMGEVFNPQTQFQVTWPAEPVIAKAYFDQLRRDHGLKNRTHKKAIKALERAEKLLTNDEKDGKLAKKLADMVESIKLSSESALANKRVAELKAVVDEISGKIG